MNRSYCCSGYSLFLRELSEVAVGIAEEGMGEDIVGLGELDDDERARVGERREERLSIVFLSLLFLL